MQCPVHNIGVQLDDEVDETEGSLREMDVADVDGREATVAFITGTGTGTGTVTFKFGEGIKFDGCVAASVGVGV